MTPDLAPVEGFGGPFFAFFVSVSGLMLGAFLLLATLIIVLARQAARRRVEQTQQFAASRGWHWQEAEPALANRWQGHPFGVGERRKATYVLTGHHRGRQIVVFDYTYETSSTDSDGQRRRAEYRLAVRAGSAARRSGRFAVKTLLVLLPIIVIVLIAVWLIVSYNRFVRQRNLVQESWRQIDVELQRRHDLIPNLVETVKAFAAQERNVLVSVIEARNRAEQVRQSPGIHAAEQAQAESQLQRAVGGLFAVAEAYPDLKSNQNFLALQQQLAEAEDRIAAGRRFYNANVRAINTRVEAFPSNLVANAFKFGKEEYFEVDDPSARTNVQVDFSGLGQIPAAPTQPAPGASPLAQPPAGLPHGQLPHVQAPPPGTFPQG